VIERSITGWAVTSIGAPAPEASGDAAVEAEAEAFLSAPVSPLAVAQAWMAIVAAINRPAAVTRPTRESTVGDDTEEDDDDEDEDDGGCMPALPELSE
jgi:hypothetical protein